jgi:Zn-finger nucleic acid-binding protein
MDCPRCIEKMEDSNNRGIATNTCLYCNGKWIKLNSLKEILEKEKSALSVVDIKRAFQSHYDGNANRLCPECEKQKLFQVIVHGIELDHCPECNGLFFDEGELKRLLPESENTSHDIGVGANLASEGLVWMIYLFLTGGG